MKVNKKHGKSLGFTVTILILVFLITVLALSISRITNLKSVLNFPKAADNLQGNGTPAPNVPKNPCQFQVKINQNQENKYEFAFTVGNVMEMTTTRVEGLVAIDRAGKSVIKKGPFSWKTATPPSWAMIQNFSSANVSSAPPSTVIIQMVVWHSDTKTLRYGCGIWQESSPNGFTKVVLDTSPYNEIGISKGKNLNSVVFTASKSLFESGYSRLEAINGYSNDNDQQYSSGSFNWVNLQNTNNKTYTHTFNRSFKTVLIGIMGWKGPDNGILKVRFGYGVKQDLIGTGGL